MSLHIDKIHKNDNSFLIIPTFISVDKTAHFWRRRNENSSYITAHGIYWNIKLFLQPISIKKRSSNYKLMNGPYKHFRVSCHSMSAAGILTLNQKNKNKKLFGDIKCLINEIAEQNWTTDIKTGNKAGYKLSAKNIGSVQFAGLKTHLNTMMIFLTANDSLRSDLSESILPQHPVENNATDINVSIIPSEADQCRDTFSTPVVTMPPQNSFPYISTPAVRPALEIMCAPPTVPINFHMSRIVTKPTEWHERPAKTQISLGIRPVWSEYLLCA